ncbi:MAG TPA: caspase family protein, partial [Candidatus Manganitrophaceae bacterium]
MNIGQSWIAAWSAFSLLTAPDLSSAISEDREFASPYQFKRVSLDDIQDIPDFGVAQRENDVAVVIGVEKYLNHLPPSDFSAGDASLVKGYLKALGVPERNIEFLINEMATQSAIVKSIERVIPNKAKKDSRVFIYYSGHGSPDPATGEGFIVPHDGDPNYLTETGYSLKRLYEKLGKLQVAEVVVILDSCFSGAGGRSVLAKGARPLVMTSAEPGNLPSNLAILAATQGNQISISSPE